MPDPRDHFPEIEDILEHNPDWLDEAIDTPSNPRRPFVRTARPFGCNWLPAELTTRRRAR